MNNKHVPWYKLIALVGLMIILLPVFAACGGGDDETTAPTEPTTGPTSTAVSAATPTPTASTKPIKIGAISPWSGSMGMSGMFYADPVIKLVESQVKQRGGILGGRPIEIVKFDDRAMVSEAAAGAIKLVTSDKVSAIVLGGISSAEATAVSDVVEDAHVPFFGFSDIEGLADKKFSVTTVPTGNALANSALLLVEKLKPATVGFLLNNEVGHHKQLDYIRPKLEDAGIKVVYSQFTEPGTTDFSPYLTKLRYENPDVVVISVLTEGFLAIGKQMAELGGWGHTQVVCYPAATMAARKPAAKGWIILVAWYPGRDYPASQKFEEEFRAVTGKSPDPSHVYFYLCFWTAINAIELAGTDDPVAVAEAARSGNLQWDTPSGISRIAKNGLTDLSYMAVQVQEDGTFKSFNFNN